MNCRTAVFLVFFPLTIVWLALTTGCSFHPNTSGPVIEGSGPAEQAARPAHVVFQIGSPVSANPSASILADGEGTASPTVTLTLILINFNKPEARTTALVQTVPVVDGTAVATFSSLFLTTVVGTVDIANGKIGQSSSFRGAIDLKEGQNVLVVDPVGASTTNDLLAETILRLASNTTDFASLRSGLAQRLTTLASDLDLGATTRYDLAVERFRDEVLNTVSLAILIEPEGAGTIQVSPDATKSRVAKGTELTVKGIPQGTKRFRGFKEVFIIETSEPDTLRFRLNSSMVLTALFEDAPPTPQWEKRLPIGGVTHLLFNGTNVLMGGKTQSNGTDDFPACGDEDAFLVQWDTSGNIQSRGRYYSHWKEGFAGGVWYKGHYLGGCQEWPAEDIDLPNVRSTGLVVRLEETIPPSFTKLYDPKGTQQFIAQILLSGDSIYIRHDAEEGIRKVGLVSGVVSWEKPRGNTLFSGIAADAAGNLFVSEFSLDGSSHLVKYSPEGSELWRTPTESSASIMAADGNGDIVMAHVVPRGRYLQLAIDVSAVRVAKYHGATGVLLWSETSARSNSNGVRSAVIDSSGAIYVAGGGGRLSLPLGVQNGDEGIYVMKFNSNGRRLWTFDTRDVANDATVQYTGGFLTLDGTGNVYLAGDRRTTGSTVTSWVTALFRINP